MTCAKLSWLLILFTYSVSPFGVGDDGDVITAALHILWLQLSPPPPLSLAPAPINSRMETFWYRLTRVHLEKWPLKRREFHL